MKRLDGVVVGKADRDGLVNRVLTEKLRARESQEVGGCTGVSNSKVGWRWRGDN